MAYSNEKIMEEVAVFWTNAQPVVYAFVLSVVPRFQDADDILQQVAVTVVKNYNKYDKKCSFVGWAIGIAKNEILMHRREFLKNKFMFDSELIEKIAAAHEKEPVKISNIRQALDVCINNLKGRGKQVLEMRYRSELSIARIAQKLGMTHGSVYVLLHRVRVALQACIDREMLAGERDNG